MKVDDQTQEKNPTLKKRQPCLPISKVKPTQKGDTCEGLSHVQEYLVRFGYLKKDSYTRDKLDHATFDALSKFQERFGLEKTGMFDERTRARMGVSRCGLPDMRLGIEFTTNCCWNRRNGTFNLTFAFNNGTGDIAGTAEFQAVRNAFQTWAAVIPFTFTEVNSNQNPDVLIDWRPAKDPDLSMVGSVMAHSDYPPGCSVVVPQNTLPLPLHFDDSENTWAIGAAAGAYDVESVALHEIGHILGLQHSTVAGAVMWPSLGTNTILRVLTQDDISGVQKCYGRRLALPGGARVAASVQRPNDQVDAFAVGNDGILFVLFEVNNGPWSAPIQITPPNFAPPGASIAAALQPPNEQLDAFLVGNNGALFVLFEVNNGPWSPPIQISPSNFAPPGANVAAVHQPPNDQLDAFVVGNNGGLFVFFEVNNGPWSTPIQISPQNFAPPGASIAAIHQPPNDQLDAFVVGNNGAIFVLFEVNNGPWTPPIQISSPNFAPPGASIAAVHQPPNDQLDVFFVGNNGALFVMFEVNNGPWSAPIQITPPNFAPPGSAVSVVRQPPNDQLSAFVVGNNGALFVLFEVNNGPWSPPIQITGPNFAPPGAFVATSVQPPNDQLDAFVAGSNGSLFVLFEVNNGPWSAPIPIS